MLTFSLNFNTYSVDYIKKSRQVVKSINKYNRDFAGDAFLAVVEGKEGKRVSLNGYASKATATQKCKVAQYDSIEGDIGRIEELCSYSFEDDVIENLDLEGRAVEFLNLRENLFLSKGCDILRMLCLALEYKDIMAARKLKGIMEEAGETELLWDLFKNDKLVSKIKSKLQPPKNLFGHLKA